MVRNELITYFDDQRIWVDAVDRDTAQEFVDWLSSVMGESFGSVDVYEEGGFWRYISTSMCGHINAYRECVDMRERGRVVVDIKDFPYYTPYKCNIVNVCIDDLI